ncbi:MAG TPA: sigma-70 family RNA polymerase sigma factor [Thermoanaerobaculia bacterium]|jgi:RNA polymerase sigma-70 factor (ECF subfamily)|nr:sigma-70 family RNA polymerase sigma factor [Thermoanaerobaculia bacterium]
MDFFPFDDEYVRRLRDGDRSTEEHFVAYFTPILRIKLRGRLPSPEAAEDARQETYLRVLKKLRAGGEIRNGHSFGAFVLTVCNNVVLEGYRQGKRIQPMEDEHVENLTTSEDHEDELIKVQQREGVRRVVSTMERRDRDILTAIFFNERPKAAVCEEFGVDQGYLRVLLHRAKEKFRKAWAKEQRRGPRDPGETDPPRPSLLS